MEGAPSTGAAVNPDWMHRCRDVLGKVLKALGADKPVFYERVNPQVMPNYYRVVTNPIFLRDIDEKLQRIRYSGPMEFANDMRLHFANVKLYHPVGDPIRKIGEKVEEQFEQWWAGTGFSGERSKRATVGQAAQKSDPTSADSTSTESTASPVKAAAPSAARSKSKGETRSWVTDVLVVLGGRLVDGSGMQQHQHHSYEYDEDGGGAHDAYGADDGYQ